MPCFHPLKGYRSGDGGFTSSKAKSPTKVAMELPCGRCLGCRIDRRSECALRQMHEASLHSENCFLTLTYAPEHLHKPYMAGDGQLRGSVCMEHFASFAKRLRRRIEPQKLRFYCKTEYSPGLLQPHAHASIFGFRPNDLELWDKSAAGFVVYRSPLLDECWRHGFVGVGDLTKESAGYVANHNCDKLDFQRPSDAYSRFDFATGEIVQVEPESVRMSTHPGIGRDWIERFECDAFPSGFLVDDGSKRPVPRYYKKRLKERHQLAGSVEEGIELSDDAAIMRRKGYARRWSEPLIANSTPDRLATREAVLFEKVKRLKRSFEG